jgi:hypothetical protein
LPRARCGAGRTRGRSPRPQVVGDVTKAGVQVALLPVFDVAPPALGVFHHPEFEDADNALERRPREEPHHVLALVVLRAGFGHRSNPRAMHKG